MDRHWSRGPILMDIIYILALALALDLLAGDPPTRFHPVGWMGRLISLLVRVSPEQGAKRQFICGTAIVLFCVALVSVPSYLLLDYLNDESRIAYIIASALLLKSTFTITGLRSAALQIRNRLRSENLTSARGGMGALVSRNTDELSQPLIVAATVESVSENTSDSIVAPLFWFLLLGVPGAIAYRMVNTFDSMIGYHGKFEYLGKFAARLDDVLNFIPARVTGLMIVVAAFISRRSASASWRIMLRDHVRTESPNAGWPMSAAAGALGVELEKVGHYRLGDARNELTPEQIDYALHLMYVVAAIWVLVCFGVRATYHVVTS